MPIRLSCVQCGSKFQAPDHAKVGAAKCPKCGSPLRVSEPAPVEAKPLVEEPTESNTIPSKAAAAISVARKLASSSLGVASSLFTTLKKANTKLHAHQTVKPPPVKNPARRAKPATEPVPPASQPLTQAEPQSAEWREIPSGKIKRYSLPRVKGLCNYAYVTLDDDELARDEATEFAEASVHHLELERGPRNKRDPNAIKIIGVSKGLLSHRRQSIGFLPKDVTKRINADGVSDCVRPRLQEIYLHHKGFIRIDIDLLCPASRGQQLADAERKKPTTAKQKEYYKFFGLKMPRGLARGDADVAINKHRAKLIKEDEDSLDEWDAYEEIIDEFDDADNREMYELKKVGASLLRDVVNQLRDEGRSVREMADDPDIVAERIIKLRPDLERS